MKRLFERTALWYPTEGAAGEDDVIDSIDDDDEQLHNDIGGAGNNLDEDEFEDSPNNDSDALDAVSKLVGGDLGEPPEDVNEPDERQREIQGKKKRPDEDEDEDEAELEDADTDEDGDGDSDGDPFADMDSDLLEYARIRGRSDEDLAALVKKHGPEAAEDIIREGMTGFLADIDGMGLGSEIEGGDNDPFSFVKPRAEQRRQPEREQVDDRGSGDKEKDGGGFTFGDDLVEQVRSEHGDLIADKVMKPIADQINAMQRSMNEKLESVTSFVQQQQQRVVRERINSEIDRISGNFKDRFGHSSQMSSTQRDARTSLVVAAEGLMRTARDRGRDLTIEQAMQMAFFSQVGPSVLERATKQAKEDVRGSVTKRSRQISLSPAAGTRRGKGGRRGGTAAAVDAVAEVLSNHAD